MADIKWYSRDPDAALVGMAELTLEQRGAYNTVLDLLYSRDGNLPDDDKLLCRHLRVRADCWRRIKAELITAGKLSVKSGLIAAKRVDKELVSIRKRIDKAKLAAEERWKNNDTRHAQDFFRAMTPTTTPTPTPTKKEVRKKESANILLPGTWEPSEVHYSVGISKGLTREEVDESASEMRCWSEGNGEKRRNWDAVFTNWLRRNARRGYGRRNGTVAPKSAILDTLDRAIEERRGNRLRAIEGPGDDGLFPEGGSERPGEIPAGAGGNIVGFPKAGD